MNFARRTFLFAGIYGLIVLAPLYFLEDIYGRENPPPVTHPEFYYGFVGVALAWQIVFIILSRDPARYRPLMLPAVLEKFSYGLATVALFATGRAVATTLVTGAIDLALGVLFIVSYRLTAPRL